MMKKLNPKETLVIIPQYRLKTTWEGFDCTSYQRIVKNFKFANKSVVCVDEAFQMDGRSINHIIGMCKYYGIKLYLVGDPLQFQPVNKYNDARDACLKYMMSTVKLTGNFRNNLDYIEIHKGYNRASDKKEYLKGIFDRYLSDYVIDSDFDNPVYCYDTGSSKASKIATLTDQEQIQKLTLELQQTTQAKHERAYRQYVKENNIIDYFVRCIKNCEYKGVKYYNGVIYKVNNNIKDSQHFIISNVYSIYTTQGQTMEKINLLKDDYELYYSSIEMVYVLISRLKTK